MKKLVILSAVAIVVSSSIANADTISIINAVNEKHFNLPKSLVLGTVLVESKFRCNARGRAGEQGLFQIKPSTARGIGFSGGSLYDCGTNAYYGLKHLSIAYAKCGTILGAAKLHNAGLGSSCSPSAYSYKVQRAGLQMLGRGDVHIISSPKRSTAKKENKPISSSDEAMNYLMSR